MDFLLFQIYAPLVSWGEIAVGGERQSARHPSKSAIIGLISAALGIKRNEEERLNSLAKSIGVAVQLHSGGSVLKDFHTVQVPKKENKVVHHTRKSELLAPTNKIGTILSRREYRCDAYSVVAVYLKDENEIVGVLEKTSNEDGKEMFFRTPLQVIADAMQKPTFHLYFGRKSSAPALPLAPLLVQTETVKEAFSHYKTNFISPIDDTAPEWLKKAFETYPNKTLFDSNISYFWEDGIKSRLDMLHSTERYDQPSSRKRWQFSSRRENMAMEKREETTNVPN